MFGVGDALVGAGTPFAIAAADSSVIIESLTNCASLPATSNILATSEAAATKSARSLQGDKPSSIGQLILAE